VSQQSTVFTFCTHHDAFRLFEETGTVEVVETRRVLHRPRGTGVRRHAFSHLKQYDHYVYLEKVSYDLPDRWKVGNAVHGGPTVDPRWTNGGPTVDPRWTHGGPTVDPPWR